MHEKVLPVEVNGSSSASLYDALMKNTLPPRVCLLRGFGRAIFRLNRLLSCRLSDGTSATRFVL
jgi:hypothetical protein